MTIKTEAGYTFWILQDGRVTDNPDYPEHAFNTWDNLQLFLESHLNQTLTLHSIKDEDETEEPYNGMPSFG